MRPLILAAALLVTTACHSDNDMPRYDDLDCGDCTPGRQANEADQGADKTSLNEGSV